MCWGGLGLGFRCGGYVVVVFGCMLVVLFVFDLLLRWFGFGLFGRFGFCVFCFVCLLLVGVLLVVCFIISVGGDRLLLCCFGFCLLDRLLCWCLCLVLGF